MRFTAEDTNTRITDSIGNIKNTRAPKPTSPRPRLFQIYTRAPAQVHQPEIRTPPNSTTQGQTASGAIGWLFPKTSGNKCQKVVKSVNFLLEPTTKTAAEYYRGPSVRKNRYTAKGIGAFSGNAVGGNSRKKKYFSEATCIYKQKNISKRYTKINFTTKKIYSNRETRMSYIYID